MCRPGCWPRKNWWLQRLFVARRERFDGADIVHVIYGTRGKLDWQRILRLVGRTLGNAALGACTCSGIAIRHKPTTFLKEVWRDLLSRFQDAVSHPDPTAKFRGSLVDDKQFAIDVNEWGLENLMQEYRDRRLKSIPATQITP